MRYRLVLITDGRKGLLERTYAAFRRYATPAPLQVAVVDDSGNARYNEHVLSLLGSGRSYAIQHGRRLGFCASVIDGWSLAAIPGVDYVFWLEDDLELIRPVDLRNLARVLDDVPQLAQIALHRNPVSDAEKAAGGYIPLRPETYEQQGEGELAWIEHRNFWTTNASLFPRRIAESYPWRNEEFCEGKFGIRLRSARPATTFGIWGSGDVWTNHIGERIGCGY